MKHFQRYAEGLLTEKCLLSDHEFKDRPGQEGEFFEFPVFDVLMTSGVHVRSPSERRDSDDVSQSQREFIDLAFRMALIETAVGPGGSSMLVLETPEASLDSIFIDRAGQLFRQYTEGNGKTNNVLIASCNLNDENMIPALLGIYLAQISSDELATVRTFAEDRMPIDERGNHLINLLDLAAPNAALRQFGNVYREKFQHAVYPDLSEGS